jgi:uracil-DNA glycosylase
MRRKVTVNFNNDWDEILDGEFDKDYYVRLRQFLINEYKTCRVYPSMYDIYNAMKLTAYNDVKCVIIGQDPYHGEGQAHGLSFSVRQGIAPPPSLVNIFKEIYNDVGIDNSGKHGDLTKWAENGVLLLNSVLTVRANQPRSHRGMGWENFTTEIITLLNKREKPMVFLLWGNDAKQKMSYITNPNHLVLTSAHPSPLSAYNGFFGCRHFSKANEFLRKNGLEEIDWSI